MWLKPLSSFYFANLLNNLFQVSFHEIPVTVGLFYLYIPNVQMCLLQQHFLDSDKGKTYKKTIFSLLVNSGSNPPFFFFVC